MEMSSEEFAKSVEKTIETHYKMSAAVLIIYLTPRESWHMRNAGGLCNHMWVTWTALMGGEIPECWYKGALMVRREVK